MCTQYLLYMCPVYLHAVQHMPFCTHNILISHKMKKGERERGQQESERERERGDYYTPILYMTTKVSERVWVCECVMCVCMCVLCVSVRVLLSSEEREEGERG